MNYHNPKLVLLAFVLLIPSAFLLGCSRGSSTIIPDDATYDSLPAISDAGQTGLGSDRQLQGMWEIDEEWILNQVQNDNSANFQNDDNANSQNDTLFDEPVPIELIGCRPQAQPLDFEVTQKAGVLVGERTADLHLNVRPFIRTPKVYLRSWNPTTETLDLDVLIENTSIYNGHDIRLIIFRDTIGHKLLNPDNYTHLWDIPEGTWSNGFKAYAKDNQNRILHAGEFRWERVQILCPGGNFSIKFAIDASWPSNCEEPYMMNNFTQGMLQAYQGATSDIAADVYDWQDNVDSVRIQCSTITGEPDTYMTKISGTKWGVELVNNNAVPEGDYFALIAATSSGSIDPLIHIVNVTVSPAVGNGWARTWGGVGNDYGYDVAVDADGNIYVTGEFESTVDFNPDPNEEAIFTSNGLNDAFLVKYDQHGDFIWVRTWGAEGYDSGQALGVDSSGNVYCGGEFENTVDFDYGPEIDNKTSHGADDCSITKYTPDGTYLWTIIYGGGHIDRLNRIEISTDGYIHAVGNFWSSNADFDPGPGQDIHSTHGYHDVYVCKFDSDGNYEWAQTWGGIEADQGKGVAVDSYSNVYCSGYFYESVDFDPGPGEESHEAPGSYPDAFLSSFDSSGNFRWVGTWGSTGNDQAWECAVDEFDDVYVVGSFYYTVDFDPDPVDVEERTAVLQSDAYVSKFSPDGDFQWVLVWGGTSIDFVKNIVVNDSNYMWIAGETVGTVDMNPGSGSDLKEGGEYISKFDLQGNYFWSSIWKYDDIVESCLVVDMNDNSYLSGWFKSYYFDFDPGTDQYYISSNGTWDCFLIKVLPNGFWE